MISEDEISQHCLARTLERARHLAASNRSILTKQCRHDGVETTVSAFFVSSKGWNERYRTLVVFDEEDDAILDYSCTCPAIESFDGMCKHCAALVLTYNDAPQSFMGFQERRAKVATSASIAAFMERSRQAETSEELGSIELETIIGYGYGSWTAHFKVAGPHGSYVVKSISEFASRMRKAEHYSYGKKLAFTHTPALFTERGQAVARFIDKAVSVRDYANGSALWRYRGRDDTGRDLDLSEAELIELIDALDGTTFLVEGTDYGVRANTRAHVEHEDPPIEIKLNKVGDAGYSLVRADPIPFAASGERMYVWLGDAFYRCSPACSSCADFLRTVYDSDDDRLFIACADMPLFCATVLPKIEGALRVQAPREIDAYRPVPCHLAFYFDKDKQGVSCEVFALYGERRYNLIDEVEADEQTPGPLRDERVEALATHLVNRYFRYPDQRIPLENDEDVANLVFGGLLEFKEIGEVFTTQAFDRLITDRKPRVSFGLSLAGNLINLTVSSDDLPASEIAALLASYKKRKRYHRLRSGAFIDLAQSNVAELDRIAADLGITAKQLGQGTVELPSFRAFYLDEELEDARRDETFTRYVERFKAPDTSRRRIPPSLEGVLRAYQVGGFQWLAMLLECGFGGILADEMGLGKSAQLIALLLANKDEASAVGPSLIVCPASLVYNWIAEFERFAPELQVKPIAGTKRERARIRAERGIDVFVTSYDLVRIDSDEYSNKDFHCCVLDEAQYIKNHATLTTRSVKRIRARHRLALTGTPMENRLSELWSIFDFLMPGLLGSSMRFRERFELAVMGGGEEAAARLKALVGPFMMRRLKAEVLRDLPDKLESVFYAQMDEQQHRLYAAHEQQLRETLTEQHKNRKEKRSGEHRVEVLAELTKLRQLCCDPRLLYENYEGTSAKLDAVVELVESACDSDEKVLVFSQFTSFLSLIAERLDRIGAPYYTLTGATAKKKRLELVNAFNEDDTPVFLMSLKAGGTGLNLTGASIVIHADPWWNAAAQAQATDRAHRIGQSNMVSVYKVIAKDTIEERILHLQEAKSELADRVIGAGDAGVSLASLTEDDLIELLQP
ncbi:DEAD/DEAH box helicase [Raoultibacter phocaeensis]|uniref:DEAD/DEAH box helicase n=1 Tax=Raoultibacter phocaeensis TaxID=2479841 RepID=UPI001119D5E0|nr:DEAD/DEAH box helicase [Raoultibacter phocaeensis]